MSNVAALRVAKVYPCETCVAQSAELLGDIRLLKMNV